LGRILNACKAGRRRPGELLLDNRDKVLEVLRKYGATQVLVFGSVARGEDDEGSDIDLIVDRFDEDAYEGLDPKAKYELEDLLGTKVDVGEARYLRKPVLREAIKDACAL
jgi:predicted nucleotidyltransferase